MQHFTYYYNNTTFGASYEPFAEDGKARFKIMLQDGGNLVIAPAGWATADIPIIWVQSEKPGDITYPHKLVQAIGEGIEGLESIVRSKIGNILFYDWNPIGDPDLPEDEYESYVPEIFELKKSGVNADTIAHTLFKIESQLIGMPGTIEHCRIVAKKIVELPMSIGTNKKTIIINGDNFTDLESFFTEIDRVLTKDLTWKTGHNMNAYNDLLRGGFGVYEYEEPIKIVWINFKKSKLLLGEKLTKDLKRYIIEHKHIDFISAG